MSGEPAIHEEQASTTDRFAGVIREPERPRGRLMIDPTIARGVAVAGAGCAALVAAAFALMTFFAIPEYDTRFELTMWGVIFLLCMTGVSIAISASQRLSSATGMRTTSKVLAWLGLVTVLLWGLFSIVIDSVGSDGEILVAGLAGSGSLIWIAATIGTVQVGTPTVSSGLRRYRQVTAGMFAIAAAGLVGAIWLAILEEVFELGGGGAGAVAGVLAIIGFWVGFLAMVMSFLGQGVARRMAAARAKSSATIDSSTTIRFACPGCSAAQEAGRGVHRCDSCGTRVALQLDEPRCRCGYTLFRMSGDRCPECGVAIPDAERYGVERFEAKWGPGSAPADSEVFPRCQCGYALAGLRSNRCPECGTSVEVSDLDAAARPDPSDVQPEPSPAETESVTSVEPPASA